jgi:thiamine-phosphate pyrophosphorylase
MPRSKSSFPVLYPILDAGLVFRAAGFDPAADHQARWQLLRELAAEMAVAGVEILQYRNKHDENVLLAQDTLAIREAAPSLRLILNDHPSLAAATGCDGVHLGQDDPSPTEARNLLGHRAIVGLSTHNLDQLLRANREPVDYIAIGPVFATSTKLDTSPVLGLDEVARLRELTDKPLVAIGGITLENAPSVYDVGIDSVAVISAIFASGRSPAQSAREFLAIFR